MTKRSIGPCQCDSWRTFQCWVGGPSSELAQRCVSVALALHGARRSQPVRVTCLCRSARCARAVWRPGASWLGGVWAGLGRDSGSHMCYVATVFRVVSWVSVASTDCSEKLLLDVTLGRVSGGRVGKPRGGTLLGALGWDAMQCACWAVGVGGRRTGGGSGAGGPGARAIGPGARIGHCHYRSRHRHRPPSPPCPPVTALPPRHPPAPLSHECRLFLDGRALVVHRE